MSVHDWLIQAHVALDEVRAATARAFRTDEHSTTTSELSQLEDRILLSATPVAVVAAPEADTAQQDAESSTAEIESATDVASAGQTETLADERRTINDSLALLDQVNDDLTSLGDVEQTTRELVIIDESASDYEQLLADLTADREGRSFEVFVLDSSRDGIQQISEVLAQYENLDALHIVSHGTENAVKLGSTWLTVDNLSAFSSEISGWQAAFGDDMDLLLYGCDLAAGADGRALLDTIGALCDCDVAASDDDTGHALFGADWDLEYVVGKIETQVAFSQSLQDSWGNVLNVTVDATSTGGTTGTSATISHTTSGTNRLMLVSVGIDPHGETITSVTYGGVNLTLIGGAEGIGLHARVEFWQLVGPVVGTADVVVSLTGSGHSGVTVGVITFVGVDQSDSVGSLSVNSGNSSSASVTTASDADDLVFATVASHAGSSVTPGAGQTEHWDIVVANDNSSGTTQGGATSVTSSWTVKNDDWAAAAISVRSLNVAPVLDATKNPSLTNVSEDAGPPAGAVGTLVSTLVDLTTPAGGLDNVTDANLGVLTGVAITAADTTNGTWFYSTNNGGSWSALGSVSNASARLLAADANTRIYFQSNANFNGTLSSAITFRAWDQYSGTNGETADTSTNGGETAFSTATDSASLVIDPVNDAPVLDNTGAMTLTDVDEDDTDPSGDTVADIILSAGGDRITDVDAAAVEGIAVIGVNDTNGSWQYSTDGGTSWTGFGSVSNTSAVLLNSTAKVRFVPTTNYNGSAGIITFRAWDQTSGSNGQAMVDVSTNGGDTAFSTDTETATLTVNDVNDEEVLATNTGTTVNETSTDNVLTTTMLETTDVENTTAQLIYTVTAATGSGTLRLSGTALSVSGRFTQADIDGGSVTYDHDGSETLSDSFDFSVDDGDGTSSSGTFNITVNPVNDEEVLSTNAGTTVNEASTGNVVTTAMLETTDVDNTSGQLTYTVTAATWNGTLRLSAAVLGVSDTFTQANIDDGLVTYDHDGTETVSDSLDFSVDDGAGSTSSGTFNITINPVNDEEILSINVGTAVNEASAGNVVTTAMLETTDVDNSAAQLTYTVTGSTGNGTLRLSGTALGVSDTFTQADIDGDSVTYDHDGSETLSDSFDFSVDDGDGTSSSGTFNFTVNPVNDEEVLSTNTGTTVNEGSTNNVVTTAMLETTDVDNAAAQLTYTVTTVTINGTLRLSGIALGISDTFTQEDIDGGLVIYDHNGSETTADLFNFSVDDGSGTNSSGMFNFSVTPVNDEEVVETNTGTTVNEASTGNVITTAMLETTDVDNSVSQLTYNVTAATGNGTLRLSGTALGISDTFTQADIDAGLVTYDHNGSETVSDSFDFSVDDGAGISSSGTFNFTITPVNDAPVGNADNFTVDNDRSLNVNLPGVLANDVDVDSGSLSVMLVTGPASGILTLAADGSFTYTPNIGSSGTDSFVYIVSDGTDVSASTVVSINVIDIVGTLTTGTDPGEPDPIEESEDKEDDLPSVVGTPDLPITDEGGAAKPVIRTPSLPPILELPVSNVLSDPSTELEQVFAGGRFVANVIRERLSAAYTDFPVASSSLSGVFETGSLFHQLDSVIEDLENQNHSFELVAGTTVVASGAISVGLVLWAARASYFVAMMSTSLPAWSTIDPIPVIDAEALTKRSEKRTGRRQDKSLADIVDERQVSVSVLLLDEHFGEQGTTIEATTRDISHNGVGLICSQPIKAENIRLRLTTPQGKEMDVLGNVRHCSADGGKYQIGVCIVADWSQTGTVSATV